MKEITIGKIQQEGNKLIINYKYIEGFTKMNHLGQVISSSGEAGGGQVTMTFVDEYSAVTMQSLLTNKITQLTEGYF